MVARLSSQASDHYLQLTSAAKNVGIIGPSLFVERLAVLSAISAPRTAGAESARSGVERAQWVSAAAPLNEQPRHDPLSSKLSFPGGCGCLYEISDGELAQWSIATAELDAFPSIPWGRHRHNPAMRLDVFLGWIYHGSQQCGRLSIPLLVALWNDENFRGVVAEAMRYRAEREHRADWRPPSWRRPTCA